MDFGNSLTLDNGFRELKRVKKLRKKLRSSLTSSVCKIHSDHFKLFIDSFLILSKNIIKKRNKLLKIA